MSEDHRRTAGRQGACLFVFAGVFTLVNNYVLVTDQLNVRLLTWVSVAAMIVGGLVWVAPWQRWHHRALLVPVMLALALVAVGNTYGGVSSFSYPVYFVLAFIWIGLAQPPRTGLLVAPFAAVAYLTPEFLGFGREHLVESATVALPVCVLVAEVIARQVRGLHRATDESARLADLLRKVASPTKLLAQLEAHEVGPAVLERVIALGYDAAYLGVVDRATDRLRILQGHGLPADYEAGISSQPGVARVLVTRGRVSVEGDYANRDWAHPALIAEGVQTMVTVPIRVPGGDAGLLVAASRQHLTVDAHDVEALELLARLAESAMGNAELLSSERLRADLLGDASLRDDLTGVGNRRYGNQLLEEVRNGDLVILADLDHFKRVNDTLGHAAGDAVLRDFATYLQDAVRGGDAVARWGGEEFLIVLRAAHDPEAAAGRLLEGWRALGPPTTFSAGAARHRTGTPPHTTVEQADAALYLAKRDGRDRLAELPPAPGALTAPLGPLVSLVEPAST